MRTSITTNFKEEVIKAKTLAKKCVKIITDKKGLDIVVLNMEGISSLTTYFVLCSVGSDRQAKTIAASLHETLKKEGIRSFHKNGFRDFRWVVLDYIDVIVHIFQVDMREYYQLEKLWGDAVREDLVKKKKVSSI
ncbi:ribosome silencing factor [Chlamydiota bacterium]